MKKLLPLLIISILVLGGFEAVAIPSEKTVVKITSKEGIEITFREGLQFGVTVTFINNLEEEIVNGTARLTFYDNPDAPIILFWLGKREHDVTPEPIPIPAGGNLTAKTGLIFGFGSALIIVSSHFWTEGGDEYEVSVETNGFILGPFAYVPKVD